jgi:TRAP-type uncharacterized transport system substrate-binding protein
VASERRRYNAGVQRSKGLLEMAAALYDSSLSYETTRGAQGAVQRDSRVGSHIKLSLTGATMRQTNGVDLSIAVGGFQELKAVAQHKLSLLWMNPSVAAMMALKGTGPFSQPLPLRVIAVFPSHDVVGFAVHESTGITSLNQIKEKRIGFNLSTGRRIRPPFVQDTTMFTVTTVLQAAGLTLADIRKWGGKIQSVMRPSHPDRRAAIEEGRINAVFDEGILSWGQVAIEHGFRYLPIEGEIKTRMVEMGYRIVPMSQSRFPGIPEEVQTLDFSGWPIVVHADMADDVAYAFCEVIEARRDAIPSDNYKPLDMAQLCVDGEETACDVPFHPGALRFYREKGYLK